MSRIVLTFILLVTLWACKKKEPELCFKCHETHTVNFNDSIWEVDRRIFDTCGRMKPDNIGVVLLGVQKVGDSLYIQTTCEKK